MNRVSYRLIRLLFLTVFLVGCGNQRDLPGLEEITPTAAETFTTTFQVQAPTDDAEEIFGNPTVLGSTSLDLGVYNNSKRWVGFRFDGLSIPKGAQIDSAVIELRAAQSMGAKTNFTVVGEAADNAATYARTVNNIGSRPTTQASVPWTPEPWTGGTTYPTSELKTLLQEVVNRPGWQTGNAAAFVVTGTYTRRAAAFDAGLHEVRAPRLVVTYTTSDTPPPPPPPTNTCDALSGTLPQPWTSTDIGTVGTAGKAGAVGGTDTLTLDLCGYGSGFGDTADAFHFVQQALTGDGTLTARVTNLDAETAGARAGVMVRETLQAGSSYAAVAVDGANQTAFSSRGGTTVTASSLADTFRAVIEAPVKPEGADSVGGMLSAVQRASELAPQGERLTTPYWLRVTRKGDQLEGYTSADGQTWTPSGSLTLANPEQAYIGLFSTGQGDAPATARFDNVVLGPVVGEPDDPPPPPTNPCDTLSGVVPAPWESADLGTVGTAGKAAFAEGLFELCGYGDGLGGATDSLHLVQQTLMGDGTLTARLTRLDAATPQAQAGVIVRETLGAGSNYAALTVDGTNQAAFSNRGGTVSSTGVGAALGELSSGQTAAASRGGLSSLLGQLDDEVLEPQANQLAAPVWVRLTRRGAVLTGYTSSDGQTWTTLGTTTLATASQVRVGLLATGRGSATPVTARFDNVTLGPVVAEPSPCELLEPALGAPWLGANIGQVDVPGKARATASRSDICGAGVGFRANTESFHYVYQPLAGNGVITAKVVGLEAGAQAGVMIREAVTTETSVATVLVEATGQTLFDYWDGTESFGLTATGGISSLLEKVQSADPRASENSETAQLTGQQNVLATPRWIRVERLNRTLSAYTSNDGLNWQDLGSVTINMAEDIFIGLTVASGDPATPTLGEFEGVTVEPLGPFEPEPEPGNVLPEPWVRGDVGAVGVPGTSAYGEEEDVFSVSGSGSGTVGEDAYHFVYRPLTGNGTVVARVPFTNTGAASGLQAGIMARETLGAASPYAYVSLDQSGQSTFKHGVRLVTGAGGAAPVLSGDPATVGILLDQLELGEAAAGFPDQVLMLTREGDALSGYVSADAETWRHLGTVDVPMVADIYVGFAVTSSSASELAVATFDLYSVSSVVTVPTLDLGAPVPAPWQSVDVGGVNAPGGASYDTGGFSAASSSSGFADATDAFHFVQQTLTGDGTLTARVTGLGAASSAARAGIMIRETLEADSRHSLLSLGGNAQPAFSSRGSSVANVFSTFGSEASTVTAQAEQLATPRWLRLTRQGDTLSGYTSVDAQTWTPSGSATISMSQPVHVGLVVTSTGARTAAVARFDNVTLEPLANEPSACETLENVLNAPWQQADVGAGGVAGKASLNGEALTLCGAGEGFRPSDDRLHYVYQPLTGNGVITARVVGLEPGAHVGVMVREALTPDAKVAGVRLDAAGTPQFVSRAVAGVGVLDSSVASAFQSLGQGVEADLSVGQSLSATQEAAPFTPQWLRLERNGSTLTGYTSVDGTTWQETGTVEIDMTETVLIGIAVASGDPAVLAEGRLEAVSVEQLPPTVPVEVLPEPWLSQDVGPVAQPGNAAFLGAEEAFEVSGSGTGTPGDDARHFVYQPLVGDGTVTAYVPSLSAGEAGAAAGLMVRETLTAGSPQAFVSLDAAGQATFGQVGDDTGVGQASGLQRPQAGVAGLLDQLGVSQAAVSTPNKWLMLTRSGEALTGYVSPDGETWEQVGAATVSMTETVHVGLSVMSYSRAELATARFESVSVVGDVVVPPPSVELPEPWQRVDVGALTTPGSAQYEEGSFTLSGHGGGLTEDADALNLVYQPLSGDGTLTAHITGLDAAMVGGVTVRENADSDAKHVSVTVSDSSAPSFVTRTGISVGDAIGAIGATETPTDEGESLSDVLAALDVPLEAQQSEGLPTPVSHWIRVTRSGTKLAGYTSEDGVSWTQIGFADIPLADVQIGLWAAGADEGVVRFENVTLGPVAEEPVEPGPGGALPEPWQSVTFGEGTGNSAYTDETDTFNLSAEGVGNTPTTHFVYQPAENDATIVARVQNLETIDQAGSAGLMIRQDTNPESAYAFLALGSQGIRFESWQGGDTEVARVEGPSASVPVWLKLERKEGSIYAYESVDGVNWVLITSVALNLGASSFDLGIVNQVQSGSTSTSFQMVGVSSPSEGQGVPYTIDTDTVGNWDTLSIDDNFTDITGAPTGTVEVPLPTEDQPLVYVRLLSDDVYTSGGGEDVLILGKKDTLLFSAANTARARLTHSLVLFGMTREETLRAYDLFPEHPRFADLVALYTEQKGYAVDEVVINAMGTLEAEIVIDIVDQVKQGAGSSQEELNSQTVHQDYNHLGLNAFRIEQGDDPRVITITADSMLTYEVFAFDSKTYKQADLNLLRLKDTPNVGMLNRPKDLFRDLYGLRNFLAESSHTFQLDVPETDCNVYYVVPSAFSTNENPLDADDNPLYDNIVYLTTNILNTAGVYTANGSTSNYLAQAIQFVFTTSAEGITTTQKVIHDIEDGNLSAAVDGIFDLAAKVILATNELKWGNSSPEEVLKQTIKDKQLLQQSMAVTRAAFVGQATATSVNFVRDGFYETRDRFAEAIVSTGDPDLEVYTEPENSNELLGVAPSTIATQFFVRNKGCRPADVELGPARSNTITGRVVDPAMSVKHSLPGLEQEGISPEQAEMQVNTEIDCETNDYGEIDFPVQAYDPELPEEARNKNFASMQQHYLVNCQGVEFEFFVNGAKLENFAVPTQDGSLHTPQYVAIAGATPDKCRPATLAVKIVASVYKRAESPDPDVSFSGLTGSGTERQEGEEPVKTYIYEETVEKSLSGSYELSASVTSTAEGAPSITTGNTRFRVAECDINITANGTKLLGQRPTVGTHHYMRSCTVNRHEFADVAVNVTVNNPKDDEGESMLTGLAVTGLDWSESSTEEGEASWVFSGTAEDLSRGGYPVYVTATYTLGGIPAYETFEIDYEEDPPPEGCEPPPCENCGDVEDPPPLPCVIPTASDDRTIKLSPSSSGMDFAPFCGPDDPGDGGPGDGDGGGGDGSGSGITPPGPGKPIKMTNYTPKRRPKPTAYNGGWGCWGRGCLWGGGGWWGWGGGGGGGLGSIPIGKTYGDPHISTADGVAYSTMDLGEFTYARADRSNGVELQMRQTRLPNFADWASFNTAAAVRAGGHTFEVRLPPSRRFGDDLILLIDGDRADLVPGNYQLGDAFFTVERGNQLVVYYEEPSLPTDSGPETTTRIRIGTMTENQLVRPDADADVLSLEATFLTPLIGRYAGFLGTPDTNVNNEFVLSNGAEPSTWSEFVESWRVTSRSSSLFTYQNGEGPETYNLLQDATMPTEDDLLNGETDYFAAARTLLQVTCGANISAIDPTFIRSAAIELAAGRTAANMVNSGICLDEHVDGAGEPEVTLSGLRLSGRVSSVGNAAVDLIGVEVTVYSPTLGQDVCKAVTVAEGRYSCGASFFTPGGSDIGLVYRITGLGAPVEFSDAVAKPAGGEWGEFDRNFEVAVDRVLHLTGRITTPGGSGLGNAHLRLTGPAYLPTVADSSGYYDVYLPLPDGMTKGVLSYEAAGERFVGYIKESVNFSAPELGVTALTRNLVVDPTEAPPPPTRSERRVVFEGRVLSTHSPGEGIEGVNVQVTAPGSITGDRCETVSGEDGSYNCITTLSTGEGFDAEVSVVNYGAAVSERVTLATSELPGDWESVTVTVGDLRASPTTLRLEGTVSGDNGPIAGAAVTVEASPADADDRVRVTATSDAEGRYTALLALPDTFTGALELRYEATWTTPNGNAKISASQTLESVSPFALTEVAQDLAFVTRQLVFVGRVVNELASNALVPGAVVTLTRADTDEVICTTTSSLKSLYTCDYETTETDPFTVRYEVSEYGTLSAEGTADPSAADAAGRYPVIRNLPVRPSTLLLTGSVRDQDARPLEGAEVTVSVGGVNTVGLTDAQGAYTLYHALPNGVGSGSVSYDVAFASPLASDRVTDSKGFTASSAALETLNQDFSLNLPLTGDYDQIDIEGRVVTRTASASISEGLQVTVTGVGSSDDLGVLCTTQTRAEGIFRCGSRRPIAIPRRGTLELAYTVGAGDKVISSAVEEAYTITPSVKLVGHLYPDIRIDPAVLKLTGRVLDIEGQPASLATLETLEPVTTSSKANARGDVELFMPVPVDERSGELEYQASQIGISTGVLQTPYTVAAGTLETISLGTLELPVKLVGRTLNFSGMVRAGGAALEDTTVAISSPTEGVLCEAAVLSGGSYACSAFATNGDDFVLSYALSGMWGAESFERRVEGGLFGSETDVIENFDLGVTALALSGTVTGDGGQPLEGATVALSGAARATLTTDAAGAYEGRYLFAPGTDTAELTLQVTYGEAELSESETFTVPLTRGETATLEKDVSFTLRRVTLSGSVVNRTAPDSLSKLSNTALTVQADDAVLCEVASDETGRYACPSATYRGGAVLTYTLSGTWGTATGELTPENAALPAVGTSGPAELELLGDATTLYLHGQVADEQGNPIPDATVSVSGDLSATLKADTTGGYSGYLIANADVTDVQLELVASDPASTGTAKNVAVSLSAGLLTERREDLTIIKLAPGAQQWQRKLAGFLSSVAVGDDGTLYFGEGGTLRALNSNGTDKWQHSTGSLTRTPTIGSDGTIYVGSGNKLVAVTPSGARKWAFQAASSIGQWDGIALVGSDTVLMVTSQVLYAVSTEDGSERWRFQPGTSMSVPPAVGRDGTIYQSTGKGLYALNPEDGVEKWRTQDATGTLFVALGDDAIYVTRGGSLVALDSEGAESWNVDLGSSVSAPVTDAAGNIYVLSANRNLNAFAADKTPLWKAPISNFDYRGLAVGADGVVYVGTGSSDNSLIAFDSSGRELWRAPSVSGFGHPTLVKGLAYTTSGLTISATSTTSPGLAESSWPKIGRDARNTNRSVGEETVRRRVRVSGKVVGSEQEANVLAGYTVTVRTESGTLLCRTVSATGGAYACAGQTQELGAVGVVYQITGPLGETSFSETIPSGAAGEQTVLERQLSVPLTTLHLYGTVTDGSEPLAGATVRVTGNSSATTLSLDDGSYSIYLNYGVDREAVTLSLTITDGANTVTRPLEFPGVAGQVVNHEENASLGRNAPGTSRWSYDVGSSSDWGLALSETGVPYVSTYRTLLALTPEGKLDRTIASNITGIGRNVAVGPTGTIYAGRYGLRTFGQDGTSATISTGSSYIASVALLSKGAMFMQLSDRVEAYTASGSLLWSFPLNSWSRTYYSNYGKTLVLGVDGTLYAASNEGIQAIHPDGEAYWINRDYDAHTLALGNDGTLYAGLNREVVAFDPDGSFKWRFDVGRSVAGVPLAVGEGGTIYASGEKLYALDANGNEKWSVSDASFRELALGEDGRAYAGGQNGVRAFDLDGNDVWSFDADGPVVALALGDGVLYAKTSYSNTGVGGGKLFAVNVTSAGLLDSPWPTDRRNNQNVAAMPAVETTTRSVRFEGQVVNPHYAEQILEGYQVELRRTSDDTLLCRTTSTTQGAYRCGARVEGLDAFDVTYTVAGTLGEASGAFTSPEGTQGEPTIVSRPLEVPITTLHLSGVVTDESGNPLVGAKVTFWNGDEVATDTNGRYSAFYTFEPQQTIATINIEVDDGLNLVRRTSTLALEAGTLNEDVQNVVMRQSSDGTVKWRHASRVNPYALALGSDGTVFTVDDEGIVALDASGSTLWTYPVATPWDITKLILAQDNTLYASVSNWSSGIIQVVDPGGKTGRTFTLDAPLSAMALNLDGTLLVATNTTIQRLDSSGDPIWTTPVQGISKLAAASDGSIYAAASGHLHVLDPNGLLRRSSVNGLNYVSALTLGDENKVFVLGHAWNGMVLKIFDSEGDNIRSVPLAGNGYEPYSLVIGEYGKIYVGTSKLYALSNEGNELWSFETDPLITNLSLGNDGNIYVVTRGALQAVDADGNEVWKADLPNEYGWRRSSLAIFDNTVYTTLSSLHAIRTSATGLAASVWPSADRTNQNTRSLPRDATERRTLRFEGRLANAYLSEDALSGEILEIRRSDGTLICRTETDNNGNYSCAVRTRSLESFDVTYSTLNWSGEALVTWAGSVSSGDADAVTVVQSDYEIPLTTVHLYGFVTDETGVGLDGAVVEIYRGYHRQGHIEVETAADGRFDVYLSFSSTTTNFPLEFYISDGLNVMERALDLTPTLEQLNEHREDFTLARSGAGSVAWSFPTRYRVRNIAAGDDVIYVSDGNTIYAVDPDGSELWSSDDVYAYALAVSQDGTLYAGTDNGVYAFDRDGNGLPEWTFGTDVSVWLLTLGADGTVYAGGYNYSDQSSPLWSLSPGGTMKWESPSPNPNYTDSISVANDGTLYVAGDDLYALDKDGRQKINPVTGEPWRITLEDENFYEVTVAATGTIFVRGDWNTLRAFNPNGSELFSVPGLREYTLGVDGTAYVSAYDYEAYVSRLMALDTAGTQRYSVEAEDLDGVTVSADGFLYGWDYDQAIAYDPIGDEVWRYRSRDKWINAMTTGPNGRLYMGSDKLYAISTQRD